MAQSHWQWSTDTHTIQYACGSWNFKNLFIRHLWCNSKARRECSWVGLVETKLR